MEVSVHKAKSCTLVLSLIVLATAGQSSAALVEIGTPLEIHSKALDRTMTLAIHLPEGYETSAERYPMLYMLGSKWRSRFALAAATLDSMSAMGRIPAIILVGIDLPDGNAVLVPRGDPPDTSSPDAHLAFLADEVVPRVDKAYRTAPFRMLYGASNSGLFTVYALLTHPLVANAYLASSPMLGWCSELLAEKARTTLVAGRLDQAQRCFEWGAKNHPRSSRAYVGMGLVHERRGEKEAALEWMRRALEVDPDDALARRQIARLSRSD